MFDLQQAKSSNVKQMPKTSVKRCFIVA